MSDSHNVKVLLVVVLVFAFFSFYFLRTDNRVSGPLSLHAQSAPGNVSGWAWADVPNDNSAGDQSQGFWISFSCRNQNKCAADGGVDYGVNVVSDGTLSGYAWAMHPGLTDQKDAIGWLSFEASDVTTCPGAPFCQAKADPATGKISGWARFLSSATSSLFAGGWDGFIRFRADVDGNGIDDYGTNCDPSTGKWSGWAWGGGTAIGWIKFVATPPDTWGVFSTTGSCAATGTVQLRGTLDGSPWTGTIVVDRSVPGTGSSTGVSIALPGDLTGQGAGTYTYIYRSGGPAPFQSITPSGTQTLTSGGTITFTFNFSNLPSADIRANGTDGSITIPFNTEATITWCGAASAPCANATSCTVLETGWLGTSGSFQTGRLQSSQTYTLRCTNAVGSTDDPVTVNVTKIPFWREILNLFQ